MLCLGSNGSGVRHSRHRFYLGDQGLQRLDDPGGPGGNVRFWRILLQKSAAADGRSSVR
jgi:hypothetical protein